MAGEQGGASLKDNVSQIGRLWANLEGTQKVTVAGVGVLAFSLLLALVFWAQTPEYSVAFTDLEPEDAAAVVEKLKEMKVPYEITGNGTVLRVPSKDLYEVRLQLAGQGLPQGGVVGFELFDKTSFGLTEFTQRINYQRALEGELARTIARLDAVQQARVHLVIPQDRLYLEEQNEPTASVVLKLRSGRQLTSAQIGGISHLVSSSVEGLKPASVTVLDTSGNVLSSGSEPSSTKASASQLEMERSYELDMQRNVQAMLERAIGPNRAVVRVNALMNWDQYESNSETYSPGREGTLQATPVTRSFQQVTETYHGPASSSPGGVPGATSNLPPGSGPTASTTATGEIIYERTENVSNYEVSRSVERLVKAPGTVEKLSVAVLLDGTPDEETVAKIEKAVAAAVGYDQSRGDTITVSAMPFEKSFVEDQERAMAVENEQEFYISLAKVGAAVVIALLFFLFLRSVLIKPAFRVMPVATEALPAGVSNSVASYEDAFKTLPPLEPLPELAEEPPPPPLPRRNPLEAQVFEMAKNQPQVLAEVIRNWMEEESQS